MFRDDYNKKQIQTTNNKPPVFYLAIRLWSEDLIPKPENPYYRVSINCQTYALPFPAMLSLLVSLLLLSGVVLGHKLSFSDPSRIKFSYFHLEIGDVTRLGLNNIFSYFVHTVITRLTGVRNPGNWVPGNLTEILTGLHKMVDTKTTQS